MVDLIIISTLLVNTTKYKAYSEKLLLNRKDFFLTLKLQLKQSIILYIISLDLHYVIKNKIRKPFLFSYLNKYSTLIILCWEDFHHWDAFQVCLKHCRGSRAKEWAQPLHEERRAERKGGRKEGKAARHGWLLLAAFVQIWARSMVPRVGSSPMTPSELSYCRTMWGSKVPSSTLGISCPNCAT